MARGMVHKTCAVADEDVVEAVVHAADQDCHSLHLVVIEQLPLHAKPIGHLQLQPCLGSRCRQSTLPLHSMLVSTEEQISMWDSISIGGGMACVNAKLALLDEH